MKKYIGLIAAAAVIAVVIIIVRQQAPAEIVESQTAVTSSAPSSEIVPSTIVPAPTAKTFTAAEVAAHNSAESCYAIIEGKVYDLTSWIGRHPGGEAAIKGLCGIDGTAQFSGQHGGQAQPSSVLDSYFIGTLAN